jgi:hypothetical protein
MKEYRVKTLVWLGMAYIDYVSGWFDTIDKAKAEMNYILEKNLPAGMYKMTSHIEERAAL